MTLRIRTVHCVMAGKGRSCLCHRDVLMHPGCAIKPAEYIMATAQLLYPKMWADDAKFPQQD